MTRALLFLLPMIGLLGCTDELAEVQAFIETTKASKQPRPEAMPVIPEFKHVAYTARGIRSPFVEPDPQLIEEVIAERKDCITPDMSRKRHPLETFAMDDLSMRGTIGSQHHFFALVEAGAGNVFRVQEGDHLGLHHGRIVAVRADRLDIVELVPEGDGCWAERLNQLELAAGQ